LSKFLIDEIFFNILGNPLQRMVALCLILSCHNFLLTTVTYGMLLSVVNKNYGKKVNRCCHVLCGCSTFLCSTK